jgi:DNA-binding HxlR family transcriptional regulator
MPAGQGQAERNIMPTHAYGQFCGLARALEIVGEPWALFIVRDLLVSPKSFGELRQGLPLMTGAVLAARLEELEHAGVIRRRVPSLPKEAATFELTWYGGELEEILLGLSRWGARTLGGPRPEEIITPESIVLDLRTTFRPDAARRLRVSYVVELGDIVVHARIEDGRAEVAKGSLPDADLIIEAGPALKALMAGEISPREAIEAGSIRLRTGSTCAHPDPGLLAWFVEIFHIPPAPPASDGRDDLVLSRAVVPAQPEPEEDAERQVPVGALT